MRGKVGCGRVVRRPAAAWAAVLVLLAGVAPSLAARPALAAPGCFGGKPAPAPRATGDQWAQRWLDPRRLHRLGTARTVRVAVLDSGVDSSHRQLAKAVDRGWDLVADEAGGTIDCVGHGTAVASLIAARPDGDASLVGVAPEARIIPIRVSENATGSTRYRDVTPGRLAAGIRRAIALKADVIHVSFAVGSGSAGLRSAVADAVRRQIVVVAAVGDDTVGETYPAAYPGVLGVGAVDQSGQRWTDSGSGPHMDLMAPGVNLVAAARVDGHVAIGGTAAAAALVSGAAALVRGNHPKWTAAQVAEHLLATADGTPGGAYSVDYGYGSVNPYRALAEPIGTPVPSPSPKPMPAAAVRPSPEPGMPATTRRALLWAGGVGLATALVAVGYAAAVALLRHRRRVSG
ncbi:S8 family serine peptidase [Micromonospora sp. HM5-17]|uniref:S8 family serine peptidase n=1 Tax=Micromonospora sp. HM5-17 TaxID=2487710 RepID=UPI001315AD9B|nr:S8 family serine peptidase [Micromonospora sp. HM5-17]